MVPQNEPTTGSAPACPCIMATWIPSARAAQSGANESQSSARMAEEPLPLSSTSSSRCAATRLCEKPGADPRIRVYIVSSDRSYPGSE